MCGATTLELKSINDLLGYKFFIPSYQRGYRWTELQVEQLLNDIWEFAQKNKTKGEFYCLQPIVVKKINDYDEYEVIDGQQRLTTIYVILSYLEKEHLRRPFQEAFKKDKFFLTYKTREKSADFLKERLTEGVNEENIDFFHMSKAYEAVKSWFRDKNFNDHNRFLDILLGKKDENPVMVIWYEVNEQDSDPIEIFTRLNIGKIPLTNSELIKAVLLKKDNFDEKIYNVKQIQIATEWDLIEKSLQDDSFWYFIYNRSNALKYENRIEYILDLMSEKKPDNEYYHTFNYFYDTYFKKENKKVEDIWLKIKKFYLTFEEWYKDFELYHYIGFLIATGDPKKNILAIRNESKNNNKDKFKTYLKDKIKSSIGLKEDKKIEDLQYGNEGIRKVLLLFNIQTLLKSKNEDNRFPFNKFKLENWDVEHVRSQTDKEIINFTEQKEWIDLILEYFTGKKNIGKIEDIPDVLEEKEKGFCEKLIELKKKSKEKLQEDLSKIYEDLKKHFHEIEQTDDIDSISNLTLLDAGTNRSYGNAFFPIKRKRIIENDKKGKFIPIATKNLFLKYYSKKISDMMYWTKEDAKDYLNALKETLKEYFNDDPKGGNDER